MAYGESSGMLRWIAYRNSQLIVPVRGDDEAVADANEGRPQHALRIAQQRQAFPQCGRKMRGILQLTELAVHSAKQQGISRLPQPKMGIVTYCIKC